MLVDDVLRSCARKRGGEHAEGGSGERGRADALTVTMPPKLKVKNSSTVGPTPSSAHAEEGL
jgi:hypothetical protein